MAWIKTNLKQYKNEQKRIDEYMDYKVKKGMEAHKTSAVLDHPDGSVTDEKIGNRTIVNPISPSEEVTGTLTGLLGVISNAVQTLRTNFSQTCSTLDTKIARGDETTLTNANEYTRNYSYSKDEVNGVISSPKDKLVFSNDIQLKVKDENVFLVKDGVEHSVFIKTLGDATYVFAELANEANHANSAVTDEEGNIFSEYYATKEEVGNIETSLDKIIEIQNTLIDASDINQATYILNDVIRQQEELIETQNDLTGGDEE